MTNTISSCNSSLSIDSMKPSILILGAGLMQRPAIQAAKSLGCQVVLVDGNPQALCVPEADLFVHLDLKDKEGIKELALQLLPKAPCRESLLQVPTFPPPFPTWEKPVAFPFILIKLPVMLVTRP